MLFEKFYAPDDVDGLSEETSTENLDAIEAEFEKEFTGGVKGEKEEEKKPEESQPDPSQAFLTSLKEQGIGEFKDMKEATDAIARINTERAHYQSGNTKLNQVFSVLKDTPGFNEYMYNAIQGAATGDPQAMQPPKALENLPENQRAALAEVIDYQVNQRLGSFKQEMLNTVSGQGFVESKPDYAYLAPRIQEIAKATGMNDSPDALRMAYEHARSEALASGQYPYKVDDKGNLIDTLGSGNGERPVQNFSQPNQPAFNGPPIDNARRFTTIPAGGANRDTGVDANIREPQTEKDFQTAWEAMMKNYPGFQGSDGGQRY